MGIWGCWRLEIGRLEKLVGFRTPYSFCLDLGTFEEMPETDEYLGVRDDLSPHYDNPYWPSD